MSNLVGFTPERALSANITASAGARARFFQTGTTTPVVVRDVGGNILAQPVLANAAGVFPQVTYTGTVAVKAVVTASDESALYTLDPCPLAAIDQSDASSISFMPTTEIPENNVEDAILRVQTNLGAPRFVGSGQDIIGLDGVNAAGVYYADPTALNSPVAAEGRGIYVQHFPQGSSYSAQIGWRDTLNGAEIWARQRQGGSYSPWRRVAAGDQSAALPATGTQVEFTNIPDWATNVVVILDEVALDSPAFIAVQARQVGLGVLTSGYVSHRGGFASAGTSASSNPSSSWNLQTDGSTGPRVVTGELTLRRTVGNRWVINGFGTRSADSGQWFVHGTNSALSSPLNGLRFSPVSGNFTGGNFYWRAF